MISLTTAWTLCLIGLIIYIVLDYLKIKRFPKKFTIKKFLLKRFKNAKKNKNRKQNEHNT